MTKLIVGLGNFGKEYVNTRHNAGFEMIDFYAKENDLKFSKNKFKGDYEIFSKNGDKIILLKPLKYMNLSGEVIRDFVKFFKINIEDILVIFDDMDIEVGSIKLKPKGSSAGHNGLKDIERHLNSQEYKRLKIGIGRNSNFDTKNYVLGKFSKEEKEKIDALKPKVKDIINSFLSESFNITMNKYN